MNVNTIISGNWATLLLPIKDEEIDFEKLSDQIDYYIDAKVDGIYSNGTAGEFYTQTESEFQAINRLLAKKCRQKNMPFQVGGLPLSSARGVRAREICIKSYAISDTGYIARLVPMLI